jgi:hypothetical protein
MPAIGNLQTEMLSVFCNASAHCHYRVAFQAAGQLETSCVDIRFDLIRKNNRFYSTIDTSLAW